MRTMVIDANELTADLWCPSCTTLRRVRQPQPGYWAYCTACGALLVDPAAARNYAGFWRRFVGWFIDTAIVLGVTATLVWALYSAGVRMDDGSAVWGVILLHQSVSFLYYWPFVAAGVTAGKFIVRVRVVDDAGGRPGHLRSLKRYLVAAVSNSMLRLGYFWMITDDRKQTWHDWMAGTYVVKR
jgi:uncharacterized RDD family membrane protein YckC